MSFPMRPPVSICLDTRVMSTTGKNKKKYPIKIKVNFKVREGKRNKYVVRRYHIQPDQVFCFETEFNKRKSDSIVILAQAKAIELFKKGLSVEEFERLYTSSGSLEEIRATFEVIIKRLGDEERDGTAAAYENALSSFEKFKGQFIAFGSITPEWLRAYEKWMMKERKENKKVIPAHSINTVGMYCRALRVVFNYAIDQKLIPSDLFPFGIRKYVIPSGQRKTKKAFKKEEKAIILAHRSKTEDVNRALDYWAFQYFANGCNMADVAYMKFRHMDRDYWKFERKKTENTERDKQTIDVYINTRMREVIRIQGNKSLAPDDYVFPILSKGMTSKQRKFRIMDYIKEINELLATAQAEINAEQEKQRLPVLTVKLTSGTTRYTVATLLDRHGIDLRTIAKALGHGQEITTELYTEEEQGALILISKALEM